MSKKQQVMEALLNSNVDLNKDDLMWINSHLPGDDGMGQYKKEWRFNHEEEDLFKCMGVTQSTANKVANVFAEATKNLLMKPDYHISNAVEEILNNSVEIDNFQPLVVSKLLRDSVENISKHQHGSLDALEQLLKIMRKRNSED